MKTFFPPLTETALTKRTEEQMERSFKLKDQPAPINYKLDLTELKRLHAEGWTDTKISMRLGLGREVVTRERQKMGLPKNVPGVGK